MRTHGVVKNLLKNISGPLTFTPADVHKE